MPPPTLVEEHVTDLDGLAGAELVGCTLEGVTGEGLSLAGMRLEDCRVVDCHLRRADLSGTRLMDVRFLRCNLSGITWTAAEWPRFAIRPDLGFAECNLEYGTFAGLNLQELVAYDCRLVDVDLGGCDLTGADLRFSDLTDVRLDGATLERADLRGATGYRFDPTDARAAGCKVSLPDAGALLAWLGYEVTEIGDQPTAEAVLGRRN